MPPVDTVCIALALILHLIQWNFKQALAKEFVRTSYERISLTRMQFWDMTAVRTFKLEVSIDQISNSRKKVCYLILTLLLWKAPKAFLVKKKIKNKKKICRVHIELGTCLHLPVDKAYFIFVPWTLASLAPQSASFSLKLIGRSQAALNNMLSSLCEYFPLYSSMWPLVRISTKSTPLHAKQEKRLCCCTESTVNENDGDGDGGGWVGISAITGHQKVTSVTITSQDIRSNRTVLYIIDISCCNATHNCCSFLLLCKTWFPLVLDAGQKRDP